VRFLPFPQSIPPPTARAKTSTSFLGIYFTLFGSSIRVLLNKRKTISGTASLLALAGTFGVLITWVRGDPPNPPEGIAHWDLLP